MPDTSSTRPSQYMRSSPNALGMNLNTSILPVILAEPPPEATCCAYVSVCENLTLLLATKAILLPPFFTLQFDQEPSGLLTRVNIPPLSSTYSCLCAAEAPVTDPVTYRFPFGNAPGGLWSVAGSREGLSTRQIPIPKAQLKSA
ncbi:hypothetical protein D3C77_582890 [compost metagenome]